MKMLYSISKAIIFLAIITLSLTRCSLFSPVKANDIQRYMLTGMPPSVPHYRTHHRTLMIAPLETRPAYNTTQMAYSLKPLQVAYFAFNEWAETPSQMLLPLVIDTLQKTNYFDAIVVQPYAGKYDYLLNMQILKLQLDFTRPIPQAQFSIRLELFHAKNYRLLKSKQLTFSIPFSKISPYAGVIAMNVGTEQLLKELAVFTTTHLK